MLKVSLIWVVAVLLAIITVSAALGSISKTKSPELSRSLFPKNGFATQAMASGLVMASVAKNKGNFPELADPAWSAMALQAFESEAISPDAIAAAALSHTGDVRRELMQKAFKLSRRQKIVTGWLIADSGERNELSALVDYYDTLLRTSSSASAVMMPAMANALAEENSVAPFADLLSKEPPWTVLFWEQVNRTPEVLGNAVQLRRSLYEPNESADKYSDPGLVRALIWNKQYREAEKLYSLLSPTSSNDPFIKNGSFEHEPEYPPFDWQVFSTGEYGATIANGNLQISAIANSGGLLARQLVRLPPQTLQIDTRFTTKIPESVNMEMRLSCAETVLKPPLVARFPLVDQASKQRISNEDSGCRYFWLEIVGRADETGDGFDIALESVALSQK